MGPRYDYDSTAYIGLAALLAAPFLTRKLEGIVDRIPLPSHLLTPDTKAMTFGAAGGATMGHSGIDMNASSLLGKRQLVRHATVETSSDGKRRRVSLRSTTSRRTLGSSSARSEEQIYDKHILANQGEQRLTGLSMRIGSRLGRLDGVSRFLKNLQQNGRVSCGWNGTINTNGIDFRSVHMQIFRHRYSDNDSNVTQGEYPTSSSGTAGGAGLQFNPVILMPSHDAYNPNMNINKITNPAGPTGTVLMPYDYQAAPAVGDVIRNAFIQHVPGSIAFCAINRPDLEDMSWNLNKLKLRPQAHTGNSNDRANQPYLSGTLTVDGTFTGTSVSLPGPFPQAYTPSGTVTNVVDASGLIISNPKWDSDVQVYNSRKHRRQSRLQQSNFFAVNPANLSTHDVVTASSNPQTSHYQYDAVIRYGSIHYEFMNKEDTGAVVEIIVFKVKKTALLSADDADYQIVKALDGLKLPNQSTDTSTYQFAYPLNKLVSSIGQGYINTVGDAYSTENLNGRAPSITDVVNNPNFPLLPRLRKTKESDNPFVEVMRNKFAMSSGSRRSLDIHLPGAAYDPNSIKYATDVINNDPAMQTGVVPPQLTYEHFSCMDEYSYAVVIAVNGQKMTRFFDSKATSASTPGQMVTFRLTPYALNQPIFLDIAHFAAVGNYSLFVSSDVGTSAEINIIVNGPSATPPGAEPTWTFWYYPQQATIISAGSGFVNGSIYDVVMPNGATVFGLLQNDIISSSVTSQMLSVSLGNPAQLPTELPMGDNHGVGHVDYAATYTEHIGACMYKDVNERNLFDCGQPYAPYLVPSTVLPKSVTSSRMILPATTVVRQAQRTSYTVDDTGAPVVTSTALATQH